MHRFRRREHGEAVMAVLAELPASIRHRLDGIRFVSDFDPAFLGIHELGKSVDGRDYTSTSHCVWPHALLHRPATDRPVTVFLQRGQWRDRKVVLHELGHALDWSLGWYRGPVRPLDSYAATNRREAFATAFQSWATPHLEGFRYFHDARRLRDADAATAAFFDRLAAD